MSSITITTQSFGAVNSTITGQAPATIVLELGTPGPQGEQGIQGIQGPVGPQGPAGASTWGHITGTLSAQTDLQNALDAKLGTSTAASTYYLQTNPAGYITSSALSPYLTSSTAASTYQPLSGMSSYLTTSAATSTYAPLVSPSLSGTPLAPTATSGDNSTQIATTAFVQGAIIAGSAHAETLQATVRNATGSTLAPFTVVYINGATGNKATVAKAQANAEATSAGTYAVTESSIANNADGNVIAAGVLSNIDTSAFADGDKLYLSPTVAGGVTTTKPSAPNHLVYVGVVTRSHPNQGTVSVRIQNGYELEELHNVAITSPATLDLLAYDSSTSLWKNQTFSTLGLETSAHAASTYYLASNPSSYITASALSPYLLASTAASTYYPLSGNPSGFLTSASLSGYATLASPTFTGTPLSTTAIADTNTTQIATTAFVVGQASASTPVMDGTAAIGTSLKYARADHVHASDTTRAALSGATFTGLLTTVATTAGTSGFNLPHGTAPTTPVNGDLWTTTTGLFWRQNGSTYQAMNLSGTQTVSGTITFSAANQTIGNSTAAGTINVGTGATISAATKAINIGTNGVGGSTTNITIGSSAGSTTTTTINGNITAVGQTIDFGNSTGTATYSLGSGATITANTKTVNIGTSGAAGSTTTITIGSATGTSTTSLLGTATASTAAQNTNTTQVATTAFVLGQASSTTPVVDGTAAVGTSTTFARADHVHPTDTSRAALASPTFTGVPAAPTAVADTNTTQIATTAFVVGQASATTPVVDGTAAVGTSLKYARADHVHPTDTSRAPLASPTFTGTVTIPAGASISGFAPLAGPTFTGVPAAPTAAVDTNTTQLATTAYVVGQGYLKSATASSTYAPLASPSLTGVPLAPTATAGTNTTQIATTAFVTAAVPAFASAAQTIAATSATTTINPSSVNFGLARGMSQRFDYLNVTQISGSGSVTSALAGFREMYTNAVSSAGRAGFSCGQNWGTNYPVISSRANELRVDFSKKIWLYGRFGMVNPSYPGDANTMAYITIGGYTSGTTGAMTSVGFGLSKAGGSGSFINLIAHNGTSQTSVATTKTASTSEIIDYLLYSDGAGNVTLYLNGTQAATTSAGPTGITADYGGVYREQVEATASAAQKYLMHCYGGGIILEA